LFGSFQISNMVTPRGAYRAATAAAKVANWVAEAGGGDTSPLVPAFAAHAGQPSMIRSIVIPAARTDATTWSSAVQLNDVRPAYCTPPQSASSLTEVIPMAFIAASSVAATPIGFIAEGGTEVGTEADAEADAEGDAEADDVTQGRSNAEPCRAQGRGPFALFVWAWLQPARVSVSAASSAVTTRKIREFGILAVNYPTDQ